MDFTSIDAKLTGTRFMTSGQAEVMYDFVLTHRLSRVLELGFAHGKSSHYLAAAVEEVDPIAGHVTTIDRLDARRRQPTIWDLGERTGLMDRITPILAHTSFTWELMRMLRADPTPRFDLVYLDGGHTWDTTGFAFTLADRLLVPGGWVVLDDLDWTLGGSDSMRDKRWVRALSQEERDTAQVRLVFELLVQGGGGYEQCHQRGGWGFARKAPRRTVWGEAAEAARRGVRTLVPVEARRKVLAVVPGPVHRLYRRGTS